MVMSAVIAIACCAAYPALNEREENRAAEQGGVLRLWHIDSFEGGIGSRASYLKRAATRYEGSGGRLILLTEHTAESAALAISEGNVPDMISFGGYFGAAAEYALPLEGFEFKPASVGGKTYAVPWCRGNYFLFAADGDFSSVSQENTVLSVGKGALPAGAAAAEGLEGDFAFEPSDRAYVSFMNGKYKYMLGTQRDIYRFRTRNFEVQVKALSGYCDLWQYICACTDAADEYAACLDFIACLLSKEEQAHLREIGMLSAYYPIYDVGEGNISSADGVLPERAVNPWLSEEAKEDLQAAAEAALRGDKNGAKKFENFLQ